MATYLAAVFTDEDGGYYAIFPDLPGCITQADSLELLEPMLKDALFVWLDAAKEDGDDVPKARSFKDVSAEVVDEEGFHSLTLVTLPEKVKRIRKNVSFTEADLAIIDRAAEQHHMDRSEFLAAAAKQVAAGACEI